MQRVTEIAEVVREGWVAPQPAAIQWDGKIMEDLKDKYQVDDRLPILISGKAMSERIVKRFAVTVCDFICYRSWWDKASWGTSFASKKFSSFWKAHW